MTTWPYMGLAGRAVCLDQPKRERIEGQRALRAEQYAIVAERERLGYQGNWATYRDRRGLGVDRYIWDQTHSSRRFRSLPTRRPWTALLQDWTPEKRCHDAFARDADGVCHHDDPAAVRWCLAGWLAHRCMRDGSSWRHGVRSTPWQECTDDKSARRLLDEVWALIPARQRAIVERVWHERNPKAATRKRLDQHPLGYWWYLAPHLATRFLGLDGESAADYSTRVRLP